MTNLSLIMFEASKEIFVLLNKYDGSHLEMKLFSFTPLVFKKTKFSCLSKSRLGVDLLREKVNEEALFSVNTKQEDGLVQRGIIPRKC